MAADLVAAGREALHLHTVVVGGSLNGSLSFLVKLTDISRVVHLRWRQNHCEEFPSRKSSLLSTEL